jgi:predicted Zn-dependent protease
MLKSTVFAALAAAMTLFGALSAFAVDTNETPASAATSGDLDSARALVNAQKYDEALPALQKLDQESPNNPDILNLIGFSLRKTGKMDQAFEYYNRALALNPHHRGANEYLGELYLETKQPDKAKERLAILHQDCGECEEYEDLEKQVAQYAAH